MMRRQMVTDSHMADELTLLPCPFCGAKLSGLEHGAFGHEIDSPDCILSYTAFDTSDIERWNTRSSRLNPEGQVTEALTRALDDTRARLLYLYETTDDDHVSRKAK